MTDKDCFILMTVPPGAFELESLNEETKGLKLRNFNLANQNIRLQSNKTFQNWDLL